MTALLVLIGLLSACASDQDSPNTQTGTQTLVAPTATPTQIKWVEFAGMSIPQGAQGPSEGENTAAPTGYSHNGPGAALAAISSTIRMSVAADDVWAQVAGTLAAPGPGRDAWSIERSRISISGDVPAGQAPTVLGYTVTEYTPERAVIAIITRQPDRSLSSTTSTVAWTAPGDWRRVLPDPDIPAPNPVEVLKNEPPQMIQLSV